MHDRTEHDDNAPADVKVHTIRATPTDDAHLEQFVGSVHSVRDPEAGGPRDMADVLVEASRWPSDGAYVDIDVCSAGGPRRLVMCLRPTQARELAGKLLAGADAAEHLDTVPLPADAPASGDA